MEILKEADYVHLHEELHGEFVSAIITTFASL